MNIESASIDALMKEISVNLKAHIDQQGKVGAFCDKTGIKSTTLYRFFAGENIGIDNFLRILRGVNMEHVIAQLIQPPAASPMQAWEEQAGTQKSQHNVVENKNESVPSARSAIRGALGKPS